jgi:site-specific recombinase XerD
VSLAVVRSLGTAARRLRDPAELEEFEQELADQYALACAGAGISDAHIAEERAVIFELIRFTGRRVWEVTPEDADRFFAHQHAGRGLARTTVAKKALMIAQFFDFLIARYQGDIHALTGHVTGQPVDEFNRPAKADQHIVRVPPAEQEVEDLFAGWRESLPQARKFLPAARDYLAASLWRRVGLRINETVMLDIRDWRPDLGVHGKLHVRFGKGSRGRGPKNRLVPAIDSAGSLLAWWMADVRHQFGEDWCDPDAPLLPSERRDRMTGRCQRIGDGALRAGLAGAVAGWLPAWQGRLTPHVLRHFCASSLYARGMDLKAIQDLLGHSFLSTTTLYIHVRDEHIENAWARANDRVAGRLGEQRG